MNQPTLLTHGLVCGYRGQAPLFHPLDLTLAAGKITALLGGNGQGKTTLMRTLLGQLKPLAGQVTRGGQVNFVPQRFSAAFSYSVLDMVLMGRANKIGLFATPSRQDKHAAMVALTQLGIEKLAKQAFNTLSGGQQQLVLIARALATECELLILDEPTAALDLSYQASVIQLLNRLAAEHNIAILFSTHDPAQAELIADEVLMLMGNQQYLYGSKSDVLTAANLTALYELPVQRCQVKSDSLQFSTFVPYFGSMNYE